MYLYIFFTIFVIFLNKSLLVFELMHFKFHIHKQNILK